jgi:hypothetical protein
VCGALVVVLAFYKGQGDRQVAATGDNGQSNGPNAIDGWGKIKRG